MRRTFLFVFTMLLFCMSHAQVVEKEKLITIANSTLKQPRFSDFSPRPYPPTIIAKETPLWSKEKVEEINAPTSKSFLKGGNSGTPYYIVRYKTPEKLGDLDYEVNTDVYIWANSERAFYVEYGQYGIRFSYGGNGKPDYDNRYRRYPIAYPTSNHAKFNAPASAKYGETISITLMLEGEGVIDEGIKVTNGRIISGPNTRIQKLGNRKSIVYKTYAVQCLGEVQVSITHDKLEDSHAL